MITGLISSLSSQYQLQILGALGLVCRTNPRHGSRAGRGDPPSRAPGPAEPGTVLAAPRGRSGAAVRGAAQQHECFGRPCQLHMRERMVILLSLKELTALLGEQWTSYCRALPGCGGRRRPSSGRRSARGISSIGRCLLN